MNKNKTLTITLSALAFLILSTGVTYAASEQGFRGFLDLTDDQKSVLEEARTLKESGDFEAAHELIKNAGIELPEKKGKRGFSEEMMQKHKDVRVAVEADDYETFLSLTEDSPMQVRIDEEVFNKLVEAHSLRMNGDHEGARSIIQEIGLGKGHKYGRIDE